MQELGKFKKKKNECYPKWIKKIYELYNLSNKLAFIDSFQFLRFPLDKLVKNLTKITIKYLSQQFDNDVLDLV